MPCNPSPYSLGRQKQDIKVKNGKEDDGKEEDEQFIWGRESGSADCSEWKTQKESSSSFALAYKQKQIRAGKTVVRESFCCHR